MVNEGITMVRKRYSAIIPDMNMTINYPRHVHEKTG